MTVAEMIDQQVKKLSDTSQLEVLDFVEYLEQKYHVKSAVREKGEWDGMSVGQAMRGMEDEPSLYSLEDTIKA